MAYFLATAPELEDRSEASAEGPAMDDHDQRFKSLLKAFFAEFFQVFFPAWADRFDFSRVDWLEQEVFTDPPRGQRRCLDLVARLPLRPGVHHRKMRCECRKFLTVSRKLKPSIGI